MKEIITYLSNYLHTNWHTIVTYMLAGGAVSLVVRFLGNFRNWEHGSTKIKALSLLSGLGSLSDWIISNYHTSPLSTLGNIGPRILVAALFAHGVLISPTVKLIKKFLDSNFTSILADAKAYRAEKSAQTPSDSNFI